MKAQTINNNHSEINQSAILLGIKGLEAHVEYDTLIYILRSLYYIVCKSTQLKENKYQLQRRIEHFEEQSNLPGFLSAIPIEQLLEQLEDAQYLYPIRRREMTFPTFH